MELSIRTLEQRLQERMEKSTLVQFLDEGIGSVLGTHGERSGRVEVGVRKGGGREQRKEGKEAEGGEGEEGGEGKEEVVMVEVREVFPTAAVVMVYVCKVSVLRKEVSLLKRNQSFMEHGAFGAL